MPKYTSIQETAYNYVRNKVLTGQLQPNVLYSETKMAAEIHISRTPMKDALVRLSQDRFIDIIPSKGFCLHKMSEEDIWHTYQARTAVRASAPCSWPSTGTRRTARRPSRRWRAA